MALLSEALLADAARVGLLAAVCSHVGLEVTLQLVGLVAEGADEARAATRTHPHVSSLAVAAWAGQAGVQLPSKLDSVAAVGRDPRATRVGATRAAVTTSLRRGIL